MKPTKMGAGTTTRNFGGQTTARQFVQEVNFSKGLVSNIDPRVQPPNALQVARNAIISSSPGNPIAPRGVVESLPLMGAMTNTGTYSDTNFSFNTVPYVDWIATLENGPWPNDTIVFSGTGTGSIINSISQGDKCIQMVNTASQTCTATVTVLTPHPAMPTGVAGTGFILALDTNWTNHANFASGYIRIGNDASNYFQWNLADPGADGNVILKFNWIVPDSTTGSPVFPYAYVVITLVAAGGGSLTVKMSNLRRESFTIKTLATKTYPTLAANIYNAYPFVSRRSTNTRQMILGINNCLLKQVSTSSLGTSDNSVALQELKTGFTNTDMILSGGTPFVFQQFPKTGSQDYNLLYFVNGTDGYFSYDPNASAGSTFTQISTTAFKTCAVHKNYMWLAGDPANPNTITPSILATPGTLDTANAITLPDQTGTSYITALLSFGDYLIIFRNTDIWIMFGTTTGASGDLYIRRSNSAFGAINQLFVVSTGKEVYHYNGNVVCLFSGVDSVSISTPVGDLVNCVATTRIPVGSLSYNPVRNCINLFLPTALSASLNDPFGITYTNSYTMTCDIASRSWTESDYNAVTATSYGGFVFAGPNGNPIYYQYGVGVYGVDTGTVTLTNFGNVFEIKSTWNNLGSEFVTKDPAEIRLFIRTYNSQVLPSSATLNFYTDYNNAVVYTTTFTPSNDYVVIPIGPGCQGHAFAIEIQSTLDTSSTANQIQFSGYAISYTLAEVI